MNFERLITAVPSVRRLQDDRDDLSRELKRFQAEADLTWLRHRPREHALAARAVTGEPASRVSNAFVARIVEAYRSATGNVQDAAPSLWNGPLSDVKHRERQMLQAGSIAEIAELLNRPASSMLCYGFDELIAHVEGRSDPASILVNTPEWLYDNLRRLAEAVGAIRVSNPENRHKIDAAYDVEQLLDALDGRFGFRLTFPNPYPGEVGIASSRGVINYRAIQAVYQANRVVTLVKSPCVLEIGPGLGRTAFYLKQFGVTDYVGIDIPLSNVAQAHFLGSTLGEDAIRLYGETRGGFDLRPDTTLPNIAGHFDVILNVDALTEMARETAESYWQFIQRRCDVFLSINHEANPFTVRDMYRAGGPRSVDRNPYWMRRGYVEEVIRF